VCFLSCLLAAVLTLTLLALPTQPNTSGNIRMSCWHGFDILQSVGVCAILSTRILSTCVPGSLGPALSIVVSARPIQSVYSLPPRSLKCIKLLGSGVVVSGRSRLNKRFSLSWDVITTGNARIDICCTATDVKPMLVSAAVAFQFSFADSQLH